VWQQVEEFGSFAAVGYEEDCVVIANISQVSMRGLASVHETRRHAHRLARRDELLRNVSGFAHAGDDEFAAGLLAVQDGFDGRFEILFGG